MKTLKIIVFDEGHERSFEIVCQEEILQPDAVLVVDFQRMNLPWVWGR